MTTTAARLAGEVEVKRDAVGGICCRISRCGDKRRVDAMVEVSSDGESARHDVVGRERHVHGACARGGLRVGGLDAAD